MIPHIDANALLLLALLAVALYSWRNEFHSTTKTITLIFILILVFFLLPNVPIQIAVR